MDNRAYNLELLSIFKSVPEGQKDNFTDRYTARATNPTVVFGLSVYLGTLGVDRFYLGQPLLGVLKLITLGGLFVWHLVDLFLVAGVARDQNIERAREIAASLR